MELIDQHTKRIMEGCKDRARAAGLRFEDETLEYIVTNRDLLELSPKVMIPTLYDYWVHDVEVLREKGKYELYPHNPYETVINTRPAISFYNDNNPDWLNVMIFYHVLAHIDFFQNNLFFRHTWDYDFTGKALSDKRLVAKLRSEKGRWVDYAIEFSRGIDNLVGYHSDLSRIHRRAGANGSARLDYYFDVFLQEIKKVRTGDYIQEIERYNRLRQERGALGEKAFFAEIERSHPEFEAMFEKSLETPPRPRPDLMQFLMRHGRAVNREENRWMKSVMEVVRSTSLFFQPQIRTKIMNEGWASYWHEALFLADDRIRGHEVEFARVNAGVTSMPRVGLNPYALGMRLFHFIEASADRGRISRQYQQLQDADLRRRFDTQAGGGLAHIFQIRENHCDFTFLRDFLDQDFVDRHRLFVAGKRNEQEKNDLGILHQEPQRRTIPPNGHGRALPSPLHRSGRRQIDRRRPLPAPRFRRQAPGGRLYRQHHDGDRLFLGRTGTPGNAGRWSHRRPPTAASFPSVRPAWPYRKNPPDRSGGGGWSTPWKIASCPKSLWHNPSPARLSNRHECAGGHDTRGAAPAQGPVTMTEKIDQALDFLDQRLGGGPRQSTVSFRDFLDALARNPSVTIRNVFQTFHDMVRSYVGEGADEYPDDPESINYVCYDCGGLFVDGADRPFFADRLFANRLIGHVESMRRGSQQNKIYIFEGPHGSGKSTFLNNLLRRFEEYANTAEGSRFETVWRLDRNLIGTPAERSTLAVFQKLLDLEQDNAETQYQNIKRQTPFALTEDFLEVGCPSHDHPLLMIPKGQRRPLLDELLENDAFKWKLFTEKEYEWIFKDNPCTICTSLYQALLDKTGSPRKVFDMIFVRPYVFNRRLGEGISVFSPGDKPMRNTVLTNEILQGRINAIFKDSNQVSYTFSRYAKTNNGIYALMDIKSHNTERLIELHNIISEGVHKVEDIEENVNSLFLALMNPEDRKNIAEFQSFSDRIEYIKIPYVLDINTEVEIYRNIFGRHIDDSFLPRVLHNFARIIVGSRMRIPSTGMEEWIETPEAYASYCDKDLLLLKIEIYTGYIPPWLREEDRKRLTFKRRKKIIGESETEGDHGFSGRDSIRIFNEFYSAYAKENKLITMADLCKFFRKVCREYNDPVPEGFIDSLLRNYDYAVLQEVKESLYDYNEDQIAREIKNYLFAVNFEIGAVETCKFTGDRLHVTEEFLEGIESKLLEGTAEKTQQYAFRRDTQREYTTRTLTQEILLEGMDITETELYRALHERYIHNLKEKVLEPMLGNENFRRAVKDFGAEDFKAYDKKIRSGVEFLIRNLCEKFRYTQAGAREVCIYVIDSQPGSRGAPAAAEESLQANGLPIELTI